MTDEELRQSLDVLARQQAELLERLQRNGAKDFWDKLNAAAPFISGVIVAVALWIASTWLASQEAIRQEAARQQELQMTEMQTVEEFLAHLAGPEDARRTALLALSVFDSVPVAIRLVRVFGLESEGARQAGDIIMATGGASIQTPLDAEQSPAATARPTPAPSAEPNSAIADGVGWAYLGTFDASQDRWATRYFDFPEAIDPFALVGTAQRVRQATGSLNVRDGMPTPDGFFRPVTTVLRVGSEVQVLEVREWHTTGYMWARISFAAR